MAKKKWRKEKDSLGTIDVPGDKYWGAQTQRALKHFSSALELVPRPLLIAMAILKKASALGNQQLKLLDQKKAQVIVSVCDEIIEGKLFDHFPLHIWQTGSGTQSNMNVNEVIANRANELLKIIASSKELLHPNDHVNMSQSSNDTFPTAMHIASILELNSKLLPTLKNLREGLNQKSIEFQDIIKIGRTHFMDAVPISLGQEFQGYVGQIDFAIKAINESMKGFYDLAIGGTAVGTGLNCDPKFGKIVTKIIAEITNQPFKSASNKFFALATHDPFVRASSALKGLAVALIKICNDIIVMGSGPRCGLSELILPSNEPGSSIMPGKINPTQCEAVMMAAVQVMGNDVSIGIGASRGNFEINVYKPLIIHNFLQSIRILSQSLENFNEYLLKGLKPNKKKIKEYLDRSLMLITALSPYIGYEKCAKIAQCAYNENITLREAALKFDVSQKLFDKYVDPKKMV
jgi:fumarate hydratase class II